MEENKYPVIEKEKFAFTNIDTTLNDKKFETKQVSYFRDAFNRFCRNKSSVVAAIIILILVLYAIFVPIFGETTYSKALTDTTYLSYTKLLPKSKTFAFLGWDGCSKATISNAYYQYYTAMGEETGNPVVYLIEEQKKLGGSSNYVVKIDSYQQNGFAYMNLTYEQYVDIQKWQSENGIQVIFPAVDSEQIDSNNRNDANIWFLSDAKGVPQKDASGHFINIYLTSGDDGGYNSLRIDGDDGSYRYAKITGTSSAKSYYCRIYKYNYFVYRYGFEPSFLFGTTAYGQDIFTRLASAARFSFVLAICISFINLLIGAIYGAIEGYYGGAIDMIMERISDILSEIPFTVVSVLFQLHLSKKVGVVPALFFAFVLTGWIGMAARVRMQFYRFKSQEYVLAARTLGASDWRLMFKHIFPNALGTIITSCILTIPGVIFSESSLTYLGIINLDSSTMTSVGTMLANGRSFLATYPHVIFFPALFISLLEISFNLFGNGLRDALNPALRGTDE